MNASGENICPSCRAALSESAYFCSQCGKKLKEPPLSTSLQRQAFVYLVSFFLAPLGLGMGFKYLKQPTVKARTIGIVSIILTAAAIALAIMLTKVVYDNIYGSLNAL